MATIEQAWITLLRAGANLDSQIDGRIYPDRLPNNVTVPAAVFLVVSDIPDSAHDGDSGFSTATIQTDFWSPDRLELAAIRAAVRADLHGYTGTAAGLRLSVVMTGSSPDNDPDLALKRLITEWRVQYREDVP